MILCDFYQNTLEIMSNIISDSVNWQQCKQNTLVTSLCSFLILIQRLCNPFSGFAF